MNVATGIAAAPLAESRIAVEGMRCAGCIARIERALGALSGVASARVNFAAHLVMVHHATDLSADAISATIEQLGFRAHAVREEVASAAHDESRALAKATAVAGFAAMNVMLLSVAIWSGAEGATRDLFHWLSALIALPAIAYAGRVFFIRAARALRRGHTNMDVPISIGLLLTTAMSLYETATGGAHAYFDGAVMLLFFLLGGRLLDSMMRARAADGVTALLRRIPDSATVIAGDGRTITLPVARLVPGALVLVAAGERICVDGVVASGTAQVDRALVTGESVPEKVSQGDQVLAGTIPVDAPLTVRATAIGADTIIAEIARMMESAGQGKSRYVRIADRAARLYAPVVHSLAALSFIGWLLAGAGVHQSVMIAVAVLIITCPCALGLAVPIAQVVASGALMRRGVLVKDGAALERLTEVDTILFDKTGTVTMAGLKPIGGLPDDPAERCALIALARASTHPLARAITDGLGAIEAANAIDLREQPGMGLVAVIDGKTARLGRPDWVGVPADEVQTATAFRWGDRPARLIRFADTLRADAPAAMPRLKAMGFAPILVSGDRYAPVAAIAARLGIMGVAGLSPAAKFALIERQAAAGKRVLMVGDGLNDGPALKRAHAAMAPATASDVGQLAADLVFFGEELGAVPTAIITARRTMAVVRQNFALAIGYNLLAVPLAIAGQVTPLIAAIAMSGSSLIVVANALRLARAAR